MNPKKFSRRRRGGMRFRPGSKGAPKAPQGLSPREAQQAREAVTTDTPDTTEPIFDKARVQKEIERAENVAAGLPPEGAPEAEPETEETESDKKDFRQPHLDTPEVVEEEEDYQPVELKEPAPKGLVESIKAAATKVIKRVHRIIRPKARSQKEVIINVESLETRVAVLEKGKLEEFTIERNTEERLVGSIFKGKVRNLEDGLKAAFVDIGFEKNAFLHYWDIVPSNFDSSVEIVERDNRKRDKPRVTTKDIPRLYPPGSDIVIQVTKGPIGTKGPRVTTNLVLPGRYLVLVGCRRPD